jgi:hypothetical protein
MLDKQFRKKVDYLVKTVSRFLLIMIAFLFLSACTHRTGSDILPAVTVDTVITLPIFSGIIDGKDCIQLTSNYTDFTNKITTMSIKSHGVIGFDESYFSDHNVLIVGMITPVTIIYVQRE